MKFEKIVKPEQLIVSVTKEIAPEKLPEVIGPGFMKLVEYIREENAKILGNPFVSYKNLKEDGQMEGELVEIEIGVPINKELNDAKDFKSYILPSYKAMSVLFKGNYSDLANLYEKVVELIRQEKGEFTGISYEYYLSDETIDSSQHETILEVVYQ